MISSLEVQMKLLQPQNFWLPTFLEEFQRAFCLGREPLKEIAKHTGDLQNASFYLRRCFERNSKSHLPLASILLRQRTAFAFLLRWVEINELKHSSLSQRKSWEGSDDECRKLASWFRKLKNCCRHLTVAGCSKWRDKWQARPNWCRWTDRPKRQLLVIEFSKPACLRAFCVSPELIHKMNSWCYGSFISNLFVLFFHVRMEDVTCRHLPKSSFYPFIFNSIDSIFYER